MGQTARNVLVAFKEQTAKGVRATGAGATVFRTNSFQGMTINKEKSRSNESRADLQTTIGRHGMKTVPATYPGDGYIGTYDPLIEDLQRGDFDTPLAITEADVTSITTTASTIVSTSGSFITEGFKVGDVVYLEGHSTAENNDIPLIVTNVAAMVLTVAGAPLTVNAVADTSFTLHRPKKVTTADAPVARYFTWEEVERDIDASIVGEDVRTGSIQIEIPASGNVTISVGFLGLDGNVLEGAESPNFTDPVASTGKGFNAADVRYYLNGVEVGFTSASINLARNLTAPARSGSDTASDVYDSAMTATGTLVAERTDMELFKSFLEEDENWLLILFPDPNSASGFLSVLLELVTLDGNTSQKGVDGPLVQTIPIEAGKLLVGSNRNLTTVTVQSTAA